MATIQGRRLFLPLFSMGVFYLLKKSNLECFRYLSVVFFLGLWYPWEEGKRGLLFWVAKVVKVVKNRLLMSRNVCMKKRLLVCNCTVLCGLQFLTEGFFFIGLSTHATPEVRFRSGV